MLKIIKGKKKFPFSRGIMARSIAKTGLSIETSYEIVEKIYQKTIESGKEEVSSIFILDSISKELLHRGKKLEEKYFRVCRIIKHLRKPIFILIGGSSGVGKSTISANLGHILGINRIVGTDTIREIMRGILSRELAPALYHSSFSPKNTNTSFVKNNLIHSFEQQTRLLSEGVKSVMKRGIKEGLKIIINGVHLVPGYITKRNFRNKDFYFFSYILKINNINNHIQNFYTREEGSLRNPKRYLNQITNIRNIQKYINQRAKKEQVKIINNEDFDGTIKFIINDLSKTFKKEYV